MENNTTIGHAHASEMIQEQETYVRERDPEQWISSTELLALVGVAQFAQRACE